MLFRRNYDLCKCVKDTAGIHVPKIKGRCQFKRRFSEACRDTGRDETDTTGAGKAELTQSERIGSDEKMNYFENWYR